MTPALRLAFLATPPALPRTWRGRSLFTEEHTEAILDSLDAGVPLAATLRAVLGPTLPHGVFRQRKHDDADAAAALAAACDACPAFAREVDAAEAAGRARLRVEGVGGGDELSRGVEGERDERRAAHDAASGSEAEHEGGEQVHASQVAAVAGAAQEATWAHVAARSAALDAERAAEVSPLDAIAREAAAYAPGDFGYVLLVNQRCVDAGMHAMSPWWRWSVGSFYASAKPWGIFLVGRGGGKSVTLERVAASVARYGARMVPPGQTWTWPFISVGPDDANRRINGIAAVFRADGLAIVGDVDPDGDKVKAGHGVKIARAPRGSLELLDVRGNEIQLASIAGTIGNVSGPSTIGLTIDEAAKLIDARGANPLTEIVASAAQTSRGRFGWRAIMSSSAYDRAGIHFQMIDAGDNESNFIATIGAAFLDHALDGFERVAAWEQRRGDGAAAKIIREHAASLRADSPLVPTWTAFPGFGNPAMDERGYLTGEAWDGAALATRMLVEALPEAALDGVPRVRFWLRECGSLPMDRAGGLDPMAQLSGLADANAALAAAARGEPPVRVATGDNLPPMKLRGMRPGDARYDERDAPAGPWRPTGWDKGDVF